MSDAVERLHSPNADLKLSHLRIDLARDTRIHVQRNIDGHIYIALGKREATIIIHPHAAQRLCNNITDVLDGKEFAHD
jgi:hypothetical protein